jgi:hypothetical protein
MRARSGLGFLAAAVLGGGCLQALGYEEPTLLEAGAGGSGGSGGASAAHCSNATKDGDETGVDCGGLCSPCKDGGGCKVGPDCQSLVCGGGTCLAPACDDKAKNGDETGTDCGGATCTKCGPDQGCASGGDCVSGTCTAMQCASTCDDGLKGGGESDVDCGGPCPGCAIGKPCVANADCESGVCESKACVDYLVWAKRFGGVSGTDDTSVVGLGIDGTGNAVLGYALRGNANLGGGVLTSAGFSDVAFARYDLLGKHLWSQRFGDADDQNTRSFSVASDGTFHAAGVFASTLDFGGGNTINSASYNNYFLAELGASNVSAWARRFGGAADVTFGQLLLAESPFGGVVFAGCTNGGTVNLGGNPPMIAQSSSDIFVALFLSGSVFWGHVFSSSFVSEINGLAVDASDNTIISGTFTGNASFGGATFSANSNEPFLAKLNSKGAPLWSMHFKDAT